MTDIPIPPAAEQPCPKCPGWLKIVPGTATVDGQFATVQLACGCSYQGEYTWPWSATE